MLGQTIGDIGRIPHQPDILDVAECKGLKHVINVDHQAVFARGGVREQRVEKAFAVRVEFHWCRQRKSSKVEGDGICDIECRGKARVAAANTEGHTRGDFRENNASRRAGSGLSVLPPFSPIKKPCQRSEKIRDYQRRMHR
jgi:hypothetical protein